MRWYVATRRNYGQLGLGLCGALDNLDMLGSYPSSFEDTERNRCMMFYVQLLESFGNTKRLVDRIARVM